MSDQQQAKKSLSKPTKVAIGALAAITLVGSGSYLVFDHIQKEEQRRIQAEQAAKEKYKKELLEVADILAQIDRDAERITNEYSQVWNEAIFDSGTFVNGQFTTDFREAVYLKRLEHAPEIGIMKGQFDYATRQIAKLNPPPKQYEQAYEYLRQLHTITSKYLNMADDPHGTLQTFNQDINQYSTDFVSTYDTFKTLVP